MVRFCSTIYYILCIVRFLLVEYSFTFMCGQNFTMLAEMCVLSVLMNSVIIWKREQTRHGLDDRNGYYRHFGKLIVCNSSYTCCYYVNTNRAPYGHIMHPLDRFHTPYIIIIAVSYNAPPDRFTPPYILPEQCHIMHPLDRFHTPLHTFIAVS